MEILIIIGGVIFVLIIVVLVRTFNFKPKKQEDIPLTSLEIPLEEALNTLTEMIKCKTISYKDKEQEEEKEFIKFEELLVKLFPNVYSTCVYEKLGSRSLLFRWPGKNPTKSPTVLMSHYDVVPANSELWRQDPFAGTIKDGYLWGRGTLDTKGTLNGILVAAEKLIKKGFIPQDDIYFAFAGDEEIGSTGAPIIVDYFKKNGINPGLVVDEGGAVVNNIFPGVKGSCALVGIAEKGMLETQLKIKSTGGHASAPLRNTIIGKLAKACVKLEKNPLPRNIAMPTKLMLDTLGREASFVYRMIFANMWLFGGLLDKIAIKKGGQLNALFRTTIAFTQMQGSEANNVIPPVATMGINSRIMSEETSETVIAHFKKVIHNPEIEIINKQSQDPSRISIVDCEAYRKVHKVIRATWHNVFVSPYLMFACSDSRHYGRISPYVYRFSPITLTSEEMATIHGNDEKISLEGIKKIVEFYIRLIQEC